MEQRDGKFKLFRVFKESLSKMETFRLTLKRWGRSHLKGCFKRTGIKRGAFLLCSYRPQQILCVWIFSSHVLPPHTFCLWAPAVCVVLCTCATDGPLYPLDMMRFLLLHSQFPSQECCWIRVWAASEIQLSDLRIYLSYVQLPWQNSILITALDSRWFYLGLTSMRSREPEFSMVQDGGGNKLEGEFLLLESDVWRDGRQRWGDGFQHPGFQLGK